MNHKTLDMFVSHPLVLQLRQVTNCVRRRFQEAYGVSGVARVRCVRTVTLRPRLMSTTCNIALADFTIRANGRAIEQAGDRVLERAIQ